MGQCGAVRNLIGNPEVSNLKRGKTVKETVLEVD